MVQSKSNKIEVKKFVGHKNGLSYKQPFLKTSIG